MSGQHNSIFRNQVLNRSDSPAHRMEYQLPILRDMYVRNAIRVDVNKLSKYVTIDEALQLMNRNNSKMITVVNEKELLIGVVYKHKLYEFTEEYRKSIKLESIMLKDPFFAYTSDSLHHPLVRLSSNELQEMPVLSSENNKVLGIITISDLVKLYDKEVEKIMKVRSPSNFSMGSDGNGIAKSKSNDDSHLEDKTSNKA